MSLAGVYTTKLKNGTPSFRASITYNCKHIALGSYFSEEVAHSSYLEARRLLEVESITLSDYQKDSPLSFEKWVSIINFRDNNIYFSVPIFLKKKYFIYYLSPDAELKFDLDDLFYYSSHKIMRRKGHLFVSDYGMQINIHTRYGIKNYAVLNRDYTFVNQDCYDYRYENIQIHNPYHGVQLIQKKGKNLYQSRIHVNGYLIIGEYENAILAAISYNKAVDLLRKNGLQKNYAINYIDDITSSAYADLYSSVSISNSVVNYNASSI